MSTPRRRRLGGHGGDGPPPPPVLVVKSLAVLEARLGGRDALVAALTHAPKSTDLSFILGMLGNPVYDRMPLAQICQDGGITAGELIAAYTQGELARAQALATRQVGARLEEVAVDTMRLALPHTVVCPACQGVGTVTPEPTKKVPTPRPETCPTCNGVGERATEGDVDHKKLALDMGRMLPRAGGVNLNVNQQQVGLFMGSAAGGSLERLQAATDAILYGDGVAPPDPSRGVVEDMVVEGEVAAEAAAEGEEALEEPPEDAEEPPAMLEGDWRDESPLS